MVACTIKRFITFGRMCSTEMRAAFLPATRAARMNSRSQMGIAAPRTTRANTGILKMPMAMIALTAPAPKIAVIRMAMTREGNAKIRSLARMINSSIYDPLRAAAQSPKGIPSPMPIPTATNATAIEVRAPTIIILKMSRPKWSVPNQWVPLGVCSLSGMLRET